MSSYDGVIIGAGIGGLVSGCYLAKEGLDVVIVEQHSMLGGYCVSFRRGGIRMGADNGRMQEKQILNKFFVEGLYLAGHWDSEETCSEGFYV